MARRRTDRVLVAALLVAVVVVGTLRRVVAFLLYRAFFPSRVRSSQVPSQDVQVVHAQHPVRRLHRCVPEVREAGSQC